ncbi:MAG: hypothetical protein AABZ47_16640 [Planctomycetota bacterium]
MAPDGSDRKFLFRLLCGMCATGMSRAPAQPVFSIDFQSASISSTDAFTSSPITEGDLLVASPNGYPGAAPNSIPGIVVFGGVQAAGPHLNLSSYSEAVGHNPGVAGFVEVDALSFGRDLLLVDMLPWRGVWTFSVDEFAVGAPGGVSTPRSVTTEGANGMAEASADMYVSFPAGGLPPGPQPPDVVNPPWNAVLFDGNGLSPPASVVPSMPGLFGFGLIEPSPPSLAFLPDAGDNIDALDVDSGGLFPSITFPIYISLDSGFADSMESPPPSGTGPANCNSANANGAFVGGDVLVLSASGMAPIVYAAANQLGLDLIVGPGSDDLDALALWENGVPGYQPAIHPVPPYDWGPGGADMLLFSVRRGSAVIGVPDSIFNIPIEEGDVLVPPLGGGASFPGIFMAAENLGLATFRTHISIPADDLDALDVSPDCNLNGVPDRLDIVYGLAGDCNENGVPDVCDGFAPTEKGVCADGMDNDCDGPMDCSDADCSEDPVCTCGNANCITPETPCNCEQDCGPATSETGAACLDWIDNDCNGLVDCEDPGCATGVGCCQVDSDCNDSDACTCNRCVADSCTFPTTIFGDTDCSGGGPVDVDDLICTLNGFADFITCPGSDLAPACTGEGLVDVDDLILLLNAFAGEPSPCGC